MLAKYTFKYISHKSVPRPIFELLCLDGLDRRVLKKTFSQN